MSRSYCEVCRGVDDTGLGICSDCLDESEREDTGSNAPPPDDD